jgi:hypothetical protein
MRIFHSYIILFLLPLFSCSIFKMEENPRSYRDFDAKLQANYRLHFKVGDKFETLKPMFLVRSTSGSLWVTPPNSMSPSLEDYLISNGKTQYDVKCLLPVGTRIQIVALKDSSMGGPIPYFLIEDETVWVKANFGVDQAEKSNNNYIIHVRHDKDLYKQTE